MAYIEPTLTDLRARFPELASVSDTVLGLILEEAIGEVGPSWIERDRVNATLYLAAHLAVSTGATTKGSASTNGAMKRRKVGDVEVEYAGMGASGGAGGFGSTAYGLRYLTLLRRSFPAVAVV